LAASVCKEIIDFVPLPRRMLGPAKSGGYRWSRVGDFVTPWKSSEAKA
jgi:hypothetical protein